jgi:guanylate kinase
MSSETGPPSEHSAPPRPGNLIVVSAPSGAGKSSLVRDVLSRVERLRYSISVTTRKPRGDERHGVDYYFVSEAEFLAMRERGEFLEWAEVHGNFYGTLKKAVEEMLASGDDVILDLDVQGAASIQSLRPDAVTVFLLPPSRHVLEERLRARGSDSPRELSRRLRNAAAEVRRFSSFKYIIVNDDRARARASLEAIILAERQALDRMRDIASAIVKTFGGEQSDA